jgi:hypothetical protein
MKRSLVLAAAAVVLGANAWVVVSAWQNRGGTPGGTAELTERELRLQPVSSDNTAVFLELRWEVAANEPEDDGAPAWLNAAKLQELGFDCRVPVTSPHAADHYRSMPPALLYVVLELDGEAAPKAGRSQTSRLRVVDVGRSARQLRTKYPDTTRHLISQGVVKPFWNGWSRREKRPLLQPRLSARIQSILPQLIYVPPPHSRVLAGLRRRSDSSMEPGNPAPRYAATVSWGRNYEPWVRSLRLLTAAPESAASGKSGDVKE